MRLAVQTYVGFASLPSPWKAKFTQEFNWDPVQPAATFWLPFGINTLKHSARLRSFFYSCFSSAQEQLSPAGHYRLQWEGTGCEIPWVLKTQPSVCKAAGACSQPGKGLANGQHVEHLGFIAFHDTWDG